MEKQLTEYNNNQRSNNEFMTPISKLSHNDEYHGNSKSRHLMVLNNLKKRVIIIGRKTHGTIEYIKAKRKTSKNHPMRSNSPQAGKQGQSNNIVNIYSKDKNSITQQEEKLIESIQVKFREMKDLWDKNGIPQFHKELYAEGLKRMPRSKALEVLTSECEDFKKEQSLIQSSLKAVKSREVCLSSLQKQIVILEEELNQNIIQRVIQKSSEILTHLRILTINAVECIVQWREQILQICFGNNQERKNVSVIYFYNDQNYLLKLKTDTKFLYNSPLQIYFRFSQQVDTFLISITEYNDQQKSNPNAQFISKSFLRRIRNCENVIAQETMLIEQNRIFNQRNRNLYPGRNQSKNSKSNNSRSRQDSRDLDPKVTNNNNIFQQSPANKSKQRIQIQQHQQQNNNTQTYQIQEESESDKENFNVQKKSNSQIRSINQSVQSHRSSFVQNNENNKPSQSDMKTVELARQASKSQASKSIASKKSPEKMSQSIQNEITVINEIIDENQVINKQFLNQRNFDEDIQKSFQQFDFNSDTNTFKNLLNISYLAIYNNNFQIGSCLIYLDKGSFHVKKYFITNLLIVKDQNVKEIFQKIVQYIFQNDKFCNEIRINIIHYEQNSKLQANQEIQNMLKSINFKWKNLKNDNNVRMAMLAITKPVEERTEEVINLETINVTNHELFCSYQIDNTQILIENPICQVNLLNKLAERDEFSKEINSTELSNELQENLKFLNKLVKKNYDYKAVRDEKVNSKEELEKIIQNEGLQIDINKVQEQLMHLSTMKLSFHFMSFNKANLNGLNYLRINQNEKHQIEVQHNPEINKNVYLIPSDDKDTLFFIYQLDSVIDNEEFKNDEKVLNNLDSSNPTEGNLWLPEFEVNFKNCKNVVERQIFSQHQISIKQPEQNIKSFKISPEANDIIIKAPFVIGAIESQIEEILNRPLFKTVIKQNDIIRN